MDSERERVTSASVGVGERGFLGVKWGRVFLYVVAASLCFMFWPTLLGSRPIGKSEPDIFHWPPYLFRRVSRSTTMPRSLPCPICR
jgi:hypothetical protein